MELRVLFLLPRGLDLRINVPHAFTRLMHPQVAAEVCLARIKACCRWLPLRRSSERILRRIPEVVAESIRYPLVIALRRVDNVGSALTTEHLEREMLSVEIVLMIGFKVPGCSTNR